MRRPSMILLAAVLMMVSVIGVGLASAGPAPRVLAQTDQCVATATGTVVAGTVTSTGTATSATPTACPSVTAEATPTEVPIVPTAAPTAAPVAVVTVVAGECTTGSPAINCAQVPASGTFTIPTNCGYMLQGSGSPAFAGQVIEVRSIIPPSGSGVTGTMPGCAVVVNSTPASTPGIAALSSVSGVGTWYRYSYTTFTWTQVTAVDQNGVYVLVV